MEPCRISVSIRYQTALSVHDGFGSSYGGALCAEGEDREGGIDQLCVQVILDSEREAEPAESDVQRRAAIDVSDGARVDGKPGDFDVG
jgi:hypothetical protein